MTFSACVTFEDKSAKFNVSDGGYGNMGNGRRWATTRAISHLFYRYPELKFLEGGAIYTKGETFKTIAEKAIEAGLMVTLIDVDK